MTTSVIRYQEKLNKQREETYEVLVVGAGPTGLTLANSLYQYGVKCKTIDARSGITKQDSKCTTSHIRILEILEQLEILKEDCFENNFVRGLTFLKQTQDKEWQPFLSVNTDVIETEGVFWSHGLSTPQWKLETAMLSALRKKGGDVNYKTRLLSFKQWEKGVIATLYDAKEDREFNIHCKYLIGCDGVNSTVRQELKIERVGSPYKDFFITSDVFVKNFNYALDKRYTFSGDKYHIHFAHLGNSLFRIFITYYEKFINQNLSNLWVGNCQENFEDSQATLKWFQEQIDNLNLPFQLHDPIRFSSYKVFLGYVKQSREERVYLAGDAAHSHTPHGGQGMNTGVMDAHNLGWKLAHTILGITEEKILNTYVDEREPVWQELVNRTDFIKDIVERKKLIPRLLTDYVIPLFPKTFLQPMANKSSMLGISYDESPISIDDFSSKKRGIRPGKRTPDGYIQVLPKDNLEAKQQRLYNLMFGNFRLGDYIILYFNKQGNLKAEYQHFETVVEQYQQYFKAKIAGLYIIPEGSVLKSNHVPILLDIEKACSHQYGINSQAVYVIRPDGYVAYRNQKFEPSKILRYFQSIFTALPLS